METKYELRRAIAQIVSAIAMLAGMFLANQSIRKITQAINSLGDITTADVANGEFGLALAGVLGGGVIVGFFLATMLWLFIAPVKDALDNRPRQPLRNR
jgi:hypothetical protein